MLLTMRTTGMMSQIATITTVANSDTETDRYGNPDEVTSTDEWRCLVSQHRSPAEALVDQDVLQADWLLCLEAAAPVTGYDRVTVDGIEYEVVGPPWLVQNPRTRSTDHVEALLRRAA
jgi:hypothetical protein